MARRRSAAGPATPERLARFAAAEWPGAPGPAFSAWRAARMAHVSDFPDSQLGDGVDVLAGHVAARQLLARRGREEPTLLVPPA